MAVAPKRKSAEERRQAVLDAAYVEFAEHGLDGASTEVIAAKAGISQPYVFRLFGTKKELFLEVVARCFRETLETFQEAAAGKQGREALDAMGKEYVKRLVKDRVRLRSQMQAYAASGDPEIEAVVRDGYSKLVTYAEQVAGDLAPEEISRFFAAGMLLNVIASMGLQELDEPWAARLVKGIKS